MFELGKSYNLKDESGNARKHDGTDVLALGLSVDVITKADDLPPDTIRMVASTEDVDRMGDIIRADGWGLEHYLKNPVILAFHNHMTPAIAFAPNTRIVGKELVQDWMFDPDYRKTNPMSELFYQGYKLPNGPFNASSVGFSPEESQPMDEKDAGDPWAPTEFIKQELLEVSAVNVPANPMALQQLKGLGMNTQPFEEMLQHFTGFYIDVRSEPACSVCEDTKHLQEDQDVCDVCQAEEQDRAALEEVDAAMTLLGEMGYEVTLKEDDEKDPDGEGGYMAYGADAVEFLQSFIRANNGEAIDEPSEPLTLAHLLDGIEVPEPEPSTLSGGDIMAVMPEVLENHLKRKADRAMRRKLGIIKEEDFNGK